jgi:hypothetical protein
MHNAPSRAIPSPLIQVAAMPDSGFFLDYNATRPPGLQSYADLMTWVFTRMNSTGGVPEVCDEARLVSG